jgi:hypothetical protein
LDYRGGCASLADTRDGRCGADRLDAPSSHLAADEKGRGSTMRQTATLLIAIALFGTVQGGGALAQDDLLSPTDYRWLAANLNVARDSLTLQGLTADEKAHVHAAIGRTAVSADKKLMDVADYLYRVNGQDFQKTLEQSEH